MQGGLPVEWCVGMAAMGPPPPGAPGPDFMASLVQLSCARCGLSGPLPAWNATSSLQDLLLPHNALSGDFPPTWAGAGIKTLDLGYNHFAALPNATALTGMPGLQALRMPGNQLSGTLPAGGCHAGCLCI